MSDNIVNLRNSPPLNDIPGQLRRMADRLESGEITAESVLFIIDRPGDWPEIYGWGEHLSDYGNIAVTELTRAWFVNNLTARQTE